MKKPKTKGEAVQLLKVHMQNAENIMKNIIKHYQGAGDKKKIFTTITEWLNTITTVTYEKIRETLYNIEQFRADALNVQPSDKAQSQAKSGLASKAISSTTKTSGTSNLVGS